MEGPWEGVFAGISRLEMLRSLLLASCGYFHTSANTVGSSNTSPHTAGGRIIAFDENGEPDLWSPAPGDLDALQLMEDGIKVRSAGCTLDTLSAFRKPDKVTRGLYKPF